MRIQLFALIALFAGLTAVSASAQQEVKPHPILPQAPLKLGRSPLLTFGQPPYRWPDKPFAVEPRSFFSCAGIEHLPPDRMAVLFPDMSKVERMPVWRPQIGRPIDRMPVSPGRRSLRMVPGAWVIPVMPGHP